MTGHAVVGGISIPIAGIILRGGSVIFRCTLTGPVQAVSGGSVTIFGDDGTGICQGDSDISWPEVPSGKMLLVDIATRMEECYGDAELEGRAVEGK